MRLLPKTMGGQLVATMLLAVLLAHAGAIIVRQMTPDAMHPLAARHLLDRMAGIYQSLRLTPEKGEELLAAIGSPTARFWLATGGSADSLVMNEAERKQARSLDERLSRAPGAVAPRSWVQLPDHAPGDDGARQAGMLASVELPDGRWLVGYQQSPAGSPWWRPLHFSIPVSTLPVLLVALPFIGRILRPIRALERAAERFSRGEHDGPLPVTGPREARELTTAFNTMAERQQRFNEDRTRMLAAISHDLRTPITSLRVRVELIDDPDLRAAMIRTLETMGLMVEQTLRFAAEECIGEPSQDIDLAALLRELATELTRPGKTLSYAGPDTLPYRCRPIALRRALGNLAENALRHGTEITLRAATPANGDDVILAVSDNGPGIPEAELERVFEPFARLDNARCRDTGGDNGHGSAGGSGVGLGLAIARSCIEAHGGTLTLTNTPPGLTATIALPT
ncbi:ATP-binding protein [Telluria beijingensis]|uniref:ATP-binding protein n=1 Tax=Telluria beijingensis TaxID=3068633 RepID=UPI002795259E|nr:ATP-binding protein [Massilia sp. REN29]